ncbi:MAG: phosphate/phosphite/phosphonate ABC transporter substrate-binding protein [Hasllibacter sp.]
MYAALPMYERPENRAAHDALWAGIRDGLAARGVPAPDRLDRTVPIFDGWSRGDLVLGQICNLPFRARLSHLTLIGTLDYGVEGAAPGHYRSVFVARADDPRDPAAFDGVFAYNEALSHSGWGAPQLWASRRGLPQFRECVPTGAHLESARAVASGGADLASIDCVTWRMLLRWEPALTDRLAVVGETEDAPGQSLVTRHDDPEPFRAAVADAIAALAPADRDALGLRGLVQLPRSDYDALPLPPAAA